MSESAEFKTKRSTNAMTALGLMLIPLATVYMTVFSSEEELLSSTARKSGLLKTVEQAIGWGPYVAILLLAGALAAIYAVAFLWKTVDARPEVSARRDHLEFHPAVRSGPVPYEEVSHWTLVSANGSPVLQIHFLKPYWSLQGLIKRKSLKLAGTTEQLQPIYAFFADHPVMRTKFQP